MIYEFPDEDIPLKQGDILHPLPFTVLDDLDKIDIISKENIRRVSWKAIKDDKYNLASFPLKPVWGIIASQDCDASRLPYILFFQVDALDQVSIIPLPKEGRVTKWNNFITKKSRQNASWFYLPVEQEIGFTNRMAINFNNTFLLPREFLENNISELRKGRLNEIAYQHYREKTAQYFRRYPYDEWYPLNKEEFDTYQEKSKEPVSPYGWQV